MDTNTHNGMTSLPPTHRVATPDLQVGDVIYSYGMRIVLVDLPHVTETRYGTCFAWPGAVTNRADFAPDGSTPDGFIFHHTSPTYAPERVAARIERDGAGYWTVQGNARATWEVEEACDHFACDHLRH